MKEVIKSIPSVYKQRNKRKNLARFFRFALVLVAFVCLYMHFYRELMSVERDAYVPWPEALYWVLTTMSTLGYGDIVFTGNAGRLFSMAVMFTGVFYLFIVLPFVFMEFLYKPFMEYQTGARVPRKFEPTEQKHVIITNYDSISHALMDKLTQFGYPFVLVVETMKEALRLHDMDIPVMLGNLDESDTFENAGIADAEMVVATDDDIRNVNIAFRARDASPNLTIVGTCNRETSEDILSLAGANHVIRTAKQMGSFLARRISCTDNNTHLIGRFDEVLIAEATIHGTPLVGKELKDANLREEYGVNVVGMWERGHFELPEPNAMLNNHTVLLMAGMEANFNKYDKAFSGFTHNNAPVIIIGAGRVGRETAKTLSEMNV
ncbi:MAG: NAD-binding protein, partial [Verrucomicrobiota bacterium]|nr:NAD-binding protein [Verrucomicrobiota bacterium]